MLENARMMAPIATVPIVGEECPLTSLSAVDSVLGINAVLQVSLDVIVRKIR